MRLQLVVRHKHKHMHPHSHPPTSCLCVVRECKCPFNCFPLLSCWFFSLQHFVCDDSLSLSLSHSSCPALSVSLLLLSFGWCVLCGYMRVYVSVCVCFYVFLWHCVFFHILVCMHVVSAAMSLCKLPALCRLPSLSFGAFIVSLSTSSLLTGSWSSFW